jgi:catechol 2,3-dioxygenase-like lactoylglutathione lyase family enzyme
MTRRTVATLLVVAFSAISATAATSVESVGMTVSDMDRAMEFYSALTFQKVSDVEVLGDEFEHLEGVFGARMRIVRMQLGNEFLDLTQYLAPPGRPIPVDSRSNELWFQHIAIVARDMDEAFQRLRALKVQFVSTGPQTLPPSIKAAAGIKAFYFRDPDQHNLEIIYFPPGKGDPRWQGIRTSYSSASIIRPLEFRTRRQVSSFIRTSLGCAKRARAKTSEPSRNI